MLPIKLDIESLDRELASLLASLEERIRSFETGDRPAYENWVRLELGPHFSTLDELAETIHARRILAHRVNSLVQNEGLHPREALYAAMARPEASAESSDEDEEEEPRSKAGFDPDEIEARRRAKIESKRARRKAEKKEKAREEKPEDPSKTRIVSLYRSLARKLHPDSPLALKEISGSQAMKLWHEVQSAYDTSNLDRLLSIAAWLGGKGDRTKEIVSVSERVERIRAMKKSIRRLEKTLENLSSHVAWEFRKKIGSERKKLKKKAARELEDEIARTQEVLDLLNDFIDSIGSAREPQKTKSKRQ
jgi:hypothetical protein